MDKISRYPNRLLNALSLFILISTGLPEQAFSRSFSTPKETTEAMLEAARNFDAHAWAECLSKTDKLIFDSMINERKAAELQNMKTRFEKQLGKKLGENIFEYKMFEIPADVANPWRRKEDEITSNMFELGYVKQELVWGDAFAEVTLIIPVQAKGGYLPPMTFFFLKEGKDWKFCHWLTERLVLGWAGSKVGDINDAVNSQLKSQTGMEFDRRDCNSLKKREFPVSGTLSSAYRNAWEKALGNKKNELLLLWVYTGDERAAAIWKTEQKKNVLKGYEDRWAEYDRINDALAPCKEERNADIQKIHVLAEITSARLPKTGQIKSYASSDDGTLERGVAWPIPRFTVETGAGSDCIIDNLTGLTWLRNTDSLKRTWTDALDYAKNLSVCGHTDWRVPNRKELSSLINYGEAASAAWLNTQGFGSVPSSRYWSSTTTAYALNRAWTVQLYGGTVAANAKTDVFAVLPVHSGQILVQTAPVALPKTGQTTCHDTSGNAMPCTGTRQDGDLQKGNAWPIPRFSIGTGADVGCVIDNLTGLMWAKSPDGTMRTWSDALRYVNDLILCGHSDWRMSNISELDSLVTANAANPAAWLNTQGFSKVPENLYWSSTTYANNTGDAWTISLSAGYAVPFNKAFNSVYVWPVRSGH